ncbi:MAG: cytochrome C [Candidatus Accumulibacter sp.]|nr:cytochrome C [Accumulibacter sp.]
MKTLRYSAGWLALAAALNAPAALAAGDKAQALLPLCASCHGMDGVSSVDLYPNLAGQKKAYLAKQLREFRSKERVNETMAPMAEPLDDAAIEQLADYFSSLSGAN